MFLLTCTQIFIFSHKFPQNVCFYSNSLKMLVSTHLYSKFISSIKLTHKCLFTQFYSILIILSIQIISLSKCNTLFNCITLKMCPDNSNILRFSKCSLPSKYITPLTLYITDKHMSHHKKNVSLSHNFSHCIKICVYSKCSHYPIISQYVPNS